MNTTPQQIDLWRQAASEHQRLEFKEAKQQFDTRKLHEYCIALANEGGGVLLLGIADKPPRQVVSTQAFPDTIAAAEKLFKAVGFRVDIEAVAHPDGRVLVFHIPSRPRGTAYNLEGKYLMRAGEALVPMSEDQLRRIFSEGQPDWLEEPFRRGLDSQEVVELLDTQTFFELLRLRQSPDAAILGKQQIALRWSALVSQLISICIPGCFSGGLILNPSVLDIFRGNHKCPSPSMVGIGFVNPYVMREHTSARGAYSHSELISKLPQILGNLLIQRCHASSSVAGRLPAAIPPATLPARSLNGDVRHCRSGWRQRA